MYSLVARQAMTDMAFVGPMTMALALGALALFDDSDEELPRRGRGLAQLAAPSAVLRHPRAVRRGDPAAADHRFSPAEGARSVGRARPADVRHRRDVPYYLGFALFLFLAARTRYKAPLHLYIAAMMCGLAVLAKGLAGLGLPVIVFVAYLVFTWNWRRLGGRSCARRCCVSLVAWWWSRRPGTTR